MAVNRFHFRERQLTNNNRLAIIQTTPNTKYIPHHYIQNPNKPGKLGVVFDAAAYFSNTCLNNHLLSRPDLLNNLVDVLLRFREGKYAAFSDIEQMFHEINVRPENQDALRILWQDGKTRAIEDHIICA